ncbi:MAG: methionine--tRNA ligase [Hyphomicrobiales bacterium]|nr:methionine--tRNA ligase [Hyphomicrobiales bacterium]
MEHFYITTAISYPNGPPHIGHAYEVIATDAIARFWRLDGRRVMFLTGTDDHGQKMYQTAREQGISPQEVADTMVPRFVDMTRCLNISNDDFIRTSEQRHHLAVQELWRRMESNGDIYLGSYNGWYSVRDEQFFTKDELDADGEGGFQTKAGTKVEWLEEESYFFRLSKYQEPLLKHFHENPDFVMPESRRNEMLRFIESGLHDLSLSRTSFSWGVPVPDNPKHIVYVWADALTNYISALGYPNASDERFESFWPASVHLIGKDIVRFHSIYWPAFLMSAGLPLPKRIFSHGFLLARGGEKMSKSLGNVVDPFVMAETYGVDAMRYFFLREVPFGEDGSYDHEAMVRRIDSELSNDFGNLAQRSLSMIAKNCESKVPEPSQLQEEDEALLSKADGLVERSRAHVQEQRLHLLTSEIIELIGEANRYFSAQEPWALRKTDPVRMSTVLYVTAEIVRQAALVGQALMPLSCTKMLNLLGVADNTRDFTFAGARGRLVPGTFLPTPEVVFPRFPRGKD